MPRTLSYVIPFVVIAGFASGCASGDPESPAATGLATIRYDGGTPGLGDAALLSGAVHDSGGCLTVEDATTGVIYTPIFPASMTSPAPSAWVAGDEVALRGGVVDAPPEGASIPELCSRKSGFWLVVDGD